MRGERRDGQVGEESLITGLVLELVEGRFWKSSKAMELVYFGQVSFATSKAPSEASVAAIVVS